MKRTLKTRDISIFSGSRTFFRDNIVGCESELFHDLCIVLRYVICFTGSRDSKSLDMTYPVLVMESVHTIADEFGNSLSDKEKRKLARYVEKLGFTDIASTFCPVNPESGSKVRKSAVSTLLTFPNLSVIVEYEWPPS